jgi:5-methylcytosine-specific restriction enzyme subunit McrC
VLAARTAPLLTLLSVSEWQGHTLEGVTLSDRDRTLAQALNSEGRLVVEELKSALRVQTRAWIGTVRFDAVEICISPKLAGDALGVTRMLAFTHGLESLHRSTGTQDIATAQTDDLLELLARLLAEATARVVRGGLLASYQEHEEEITTVRGRLLVDRQVLMRFGRVDRLLCRFDELEHDTDENRLLALALQLCAKRVHGERLHRQLRYLAGLFSEVCSPELLDLETARSTLMYDRQNAHYREAHELAWLMLDGFGVRDVLALTSPTTSFAFLLDMNSLFETFVTRLIERLFPAPIYHVEAQERNRSVLWDPSSNRSYGSIRPDVVVRRPRRGDTGSVAVDAKYKLYDVVDVKNADIYQGLLYAQAYGRTDESSVATAFLVYPTSYAHPHTERVRLRRPERTPVADLVMIGLPVSSTLEQLRVLNGSPGVMLRDTIAAALGGA